MSESKTCLILGRKGTIVKQVSQEINYNGITILEGTNFDDVKQAFKEHSVDAVIMGAGIALDNRLDIVKYIFDQSKSTTVHMKDWNSGPEGMLPFVLNALHNLQ